MNFASVGELATKQDCVARRDQVLTLVTEGRLRAQLEARRWRAVSSTVICLHNGPMTPSQQHWAVVLAGGVGAALAGRTALELGGLKNWAVDPVHVLVPLGGRLTDLVDVDVVAHQSRTFAESDIAAASPPRTSVARATIDAATWSRPPRTAAGLVTAVVQQGLASVPQLRDALDRAGAIRHAPLLRSVLNDVEGGAQALSEIDFGSLCRRFGLPEPLRQAIRTDGDGRRRYLDALLVGPDGREVGVEIDGAHHMQASQWDRDLDRTNELTIGGSAVLHFTATRVRLQPARVASQLRRALGSRKRLPGL
ncbi:MAG TPA: DUF559 domain-containing protein [Frankiaceae bacterium]|nr:DUF559 domain-containing protein [Frankiaceae bacterium]